jgi:muconolactone delta-isomerase
MKTLEKIVLHPNLENKHRIEVRQWMEQNANTDTWCMNSNYDAHGTFDITMYGKENETLATMFLIKYPNTKIVEQQYHETYEIAPEALSLFNFGE